MSKEKNLLPLDPLASAEPVAAQRTTLGKSLDKTDAVVTEVWCLLPIRHLSWSSLNSYNTRGQIIRSSRITLETESLSLATIRSLAKPTTAQEEGPTVVVNEELW